MNDRVSQKPPSAYIHEEEAMDRYMTPAGATFQSREQVTDKQETDTFYDAGIISSKHSGMFRFGKAIVNAFNPANVWQGINGIWKETEDSKSPEKTVLQERQTKAEKAYAELKKSGFKGTKAPPAGRANKDLPTIRYEDVVPREAPFRDSGVDMDGYPSSTERSKDNLVTIPAEALMPPPLIPGPGRSPSPMGGISTGRRSSLNLHKPSFQELKKIKSHFHLSPTKRAQSEISLPLPSIEIDATASTAVTAQPLRNQPSKQELVKQQKLTKRVSDLETKLERARRELDGLQEPSKRGSKPFKPGALPSLPSQRILNSLGGSKDLEGGNEVNVYDKSNSTRDLGPNYGRDVTPQVNAQLQSELKFSVSRSSVSRKRKSDDALFKPGRNYEDTCGSDFDPAGKDVTRKASVRSRKSQKIENPTAIDFVKSRNETNVTPNGPRRISSRRTLDPVPPLPTNPKVFDLMEIDQAKILSMRPVSDSKLPFGKLSDDIINLRTLYPSMSESFLDDYIANLPANKKKTDHTSLSHHDRPASPFLAPPLSASPKKTRARKAKRGISPPPPSLISPKRRAIEVEPKEEEDAATVDSEGHDTVAPLPESLLNSKANATAKHADKPLPGIQKEDFEWPEDVF